MRRRNGDVAVVGLACRFPGSANVHEFWANILGNRDLLREIPADRWPISLFHDPSPVTNDRVACRRGGYLDTPIEFDSASQGILPLAVAGGEPEQFLVLDAARAALADAGIDQEGMSRLRVEAVIGRGNYFNRGNLTRLQHGRIVAQTVGLLAALHPEWTKEDLDLFRRELKSNLPPFEAATIPGQLTNATAGRIADQFDLKGPCYVVDAASASSLVALDLGRRSLLDDRADLVLVGGVYIEADVDFPMVFQQLRVLSRSGEARPFSADADGLVPGEGVGVVVLKRLRDAERDGDRVYAVVKAVGLASDGRGRGLVAPSARGHARAMRLAYREAGIDPASVALIEGHGLGVPVSDRAELRALRAVFRPEGRPTRVLGAVSSQVGHAMPAAGMAGFIKTALALHHRTLPPTRYVDRPSSLLAGSGMEIIGEPRPWIHGVRTTPRRAGVNAFGFCGINSHAVLEEHPASADGTSAGVMLEWDREAFLLQAPDRQALADRVRKLREQLGIGYRGSLKDLAYTVNVCDCIKEGPARLGLVVGSAEELVRHIDAVEPRLRDASCESIRDARGIYFRASPLAGEGGLAFLFPGEGSQYQGMLSDLCPHFPELRAVFDTADRITLESGEEVLPSQHLFGAASPDSSALWATDVAVTAVLSSQWGMFQVLTRLGLRPDAVAGHSSGELLALAAAGAIRTERALEAQLAELAAIFRRLESSGAIPGARLIAAGTSRARAQAACRESGGSVSVAIDNCPHQVVLAGPEEEVEAVVSRLRSAGVLCEDLPFGRAYHTAGFAAVMAPLEAFYEGLDLHPQRIPIYSCSSASRMPASPEELRSLAAGQWTRPVAFRETVEAMYRDGVRLFVDVGARGNLCGYVEDTLRGRPAFAVAANLPRRSGTVQLNHLVASLFAHGVSLDTSYLYARRRPRRVDFDARDERPRSTVPIRLGFPEMKLTEAAIQRLTGRKERAPDERPSRGPMPEADAAALPNGMAANGTPSTGSNGTAHGKGPRMDLWTAETIVGHMAQHTGNGHHRSSDRVPIDESRVTPTERDAAVLGYLATMNEFLETQRQVVESYLAGGAVPSAADRASDDAMADGPRQGPSPAPGPWVSEVLEWSPGRSIKACHRLTGIDDPVAENHTLGGRRVSELQPDRKGLPVVPFALMTEMVAQVGSMLVPPDLILESLHDVRAHRWVPYEESGVLELRGECDPAEPSRVQVRMYYRKKEPSAHGTGEGRLVFEGTAWFGGQRLDPLPSGASRLRQPRHSRFTAKRLYEEQWLFHGPPLQALVEVGPVSPEGIAGSIRVLPLAALVPHGSESSFHTDPIVLDTFTHLLGCWGLECLEGGDVIFPLSMGRLSIYGDPPAEGSLVDCRVHIRAIEHHLVRAEAEIARPDGRVWMRIADWEDWRFHWPSRFRDVFRAPERVFVGEELGLSGLPSDEAAAVWLAPPADMARPVWRDVLESTQLSPDELSTCRDLEEDDSRRTHWLWGRIAAKEAVRRIWRSSDQPDRYPADLCVENDPSGRPLLIDLAGPDDGRMPAVSIAHEEGLTVALAARHPCTRAGIDVVSLLSPALDQRAGDLTVGERALLARWSGEDSVEWSGRLIAARQAAAKAVGLGPRATGERVEVREIDAESGRMAVEVRDTLGNTSGEILVAHTKHRSEHVWAWTLGEDPGRLP